VSGTVAASQLTGTIPPANIATGSITTVMLASNSVTTGDLADNAVGFAKLDTVFDGQLARTIQDPFNTNLYAGPGLPQILEDGLQHRFGHSVAPLQSLLIVGSPGRDFYQITTICQPLIGCFNLVNLPVRDVGGIYLFAPDGSPILGMSLPDGIGQGAQDAQFGFSVAATSSGQILAGAPGIQRAYVFNTSGGLVTTLNAPYTSASGRFGHAVAGMGNGSRAVGDPDYTPGVVTVFSGGFVRQLTPPASVFEFGEAVAAVGSSSLVVGAPFGGLGNGGVAFLYTQSFPDGVPQLVTSFTNRPVAFGFGRAVAALGGDKVIIGAPLTAGGGAAFLFATNGVLLATLTNPFPTIDAGFGFSVSGVSSNRILVGAQSSGRAFLFDTSARLVGVYNNPTPGTASGVSSFGSNQVAIGLADVLPNGFGRGAVHVFNLDGPDFIPGLSVERGSITTESIADGAVTAAKISGVLNPAQIPNLDATKITSGTLNDARLSTNVALRSGGNTFSGNQAIASGFLLMDNAQAIYARNTSGQPEVLLWPRYSDDVTYLNYGSGGFNIRNNANETAMFMYDNGDVSVGSGTHDASLTLNDISSAKWKLHTAGFKLRIQNDNGGAFTEKMVIENNGYVGIGTASPQRLLQVGDLGILGSEAVIKLASRAPASGAARDWEMGVPAPGDSAVGIAYSFNIHDGGMSYPSQFLIQWGTGNVGIANTNPTQLLVVGNAASPAYCNGVTWVNGSDRNAKENFKSIDPVDVLARVVSLPVQSWSYKAKPGEEHIGPMAQDFHAAFGLNGDDDRHIATVDESGVALAAIQGLNQKLEQKEAEISELKARLSRLERLLEGAK
jgi:hypothetical protein